MVVTSLNDKFSPKYKVWLMSSAQRDSGTEDHDHILILYRGFNEVASRIQLI